jgi:5'-nucleotidase / UDP-sugar diphosphatase
MPALAIVHTSDFHGHLTEAAARALSTLKAEENALLLDSGDALLLPQWLPYVHDDPVIRRMNLAGYDAMAAGNHEFYLRSGQMARRTRHLAFPVLCANLLWRPEDTANLRRWTVLLTSAGDSIGVFGLMPPMVPPGTSLERISDMRFIPWEQATEEAIATLRPQVTWLVALLHIGQTGDALIAQRFPQIDLILAGHSHQVTAEPELIGNTTVVRSGCRGRFASVLRSDVDGPPATFSLRRVELP